VARCRRAAAPLSAAPWARLPEDERERLWLVSNAVFVRAAARP
jgi:hypothetical protein